MPLSLYATYGSFVFDTYCVVMCILTLNGGVEVTRDYPKLKNQPLTLVVAEFRFAPLELESDGLWSFRMHLDERLGGRATQRTIQNAHFEPEGLRVNASPLLCWMSSSAAEAVHLESDRLIFATTQYPRFPSFSNSARALLSTLHETMPLKAVQRIGLRYNDAIVPQPDESLGDYLQAAFLPWTSIGSEPQPVVQHATETVLSTVAGSLVIRTLLGQHGRCQMPDVQERFGLKPTITVPKDRATAVLDFDHYWQDTAHPTSAFDIDMAMDHLNALHEPAREAFWSITTDFAREEKWL